MADTRSFRESNLYGSPIRDLQLAIEDTRLAPVIDEFRAELARLGIAKVTPTFYLSTEWGVSFGTVAIAIPFYLAQAGAHGAARRARRPHRRLQRRRTSCATCGTRWATS